MKLLDKLNSPVRPQALGLFRIIFGIILLWDLGRIKSTGLVDSLYVHDHIFYYDFLKLPFPSQEVLNGLISLLFICAVFITTGLFYRWAMSFFALGFTYFFFLDPVLYNNHLYLICLLSFLMVFIPADASFSLSKSRRANYIYRWHYLILQFHIILVYFMGGVVKLNPYWLDLHPVIEIAQATSARTGFSFFTDSWFVYLLAYGGIVFDLLIGPLLLITKTRKVAFILAIGFNLTNSYIFNDIFIFPFFMISSLLLFVDVDKFHQRIANLKLIAKDIESKNRGALGRVGLFILSVYIVYHLFMPFRHFLYEGYTDWTGEGQRFAWRMKIQHRKVTETLFLLMDVDRKVIHEVDPKNYLFPDEVDQMCNSPQMIVQFAHYLKDVIAPKNDINNCWVKSRIKVSFNGLPAQYVFDPELDLIAASLRKKSINDFIEPLNKKAE